MQELANLEWGHLDLGKTPTVSYKTRDNFRTKTGKSRTIPLERGLADRLAEWRVKNPTSFLLFPAEQGKVEGHFLRLCKEYAKLSGQHEEKFWLHKFRDTFATWALRRGVDIRMVQHWLGHASIEMTQRYLAPEQGEHAQGQINRAFGSFDSTKLAEKMRFHQVVPMNVTDTSHCRLYPGCCTYILRLAGKLRCDDITQGTANKEIRRYSCIRVNVDRYASCVMPVTSLLLSNERQSRRIKEI